MDIIESGTSGADFTKFERAVDRMEGVETLPTVAQRLLALASDPDASFDDIEALIAADAALTARVLRVAASAFYGGKAAANLQAALVRLGLSEVRNLAVTAAVTRSAADPFHRALWRRSLATAVFADTVAKQLGRDRFREPFVCGLLHDLGTLVFAGIEGATYQTLIGEVDHGTQVAREQRIYGFTHCDLGALAAQRWNFFDGLEQVIQFHADPDAAAPLDFPAPVLATIYLIALAGHWLADPDQPPGEARCAALLEALGTSERDLREAWERTQGQLQDYLRALG